MKRSRNPDVDGTRKWRTLVALLPSNRGTVAVATLASASGVSRDAVIYALRLWTKKGIITCVPVIGRPGLRNIEILSPNVPLEELRERGRVSRPRVRSHAPVVVTLDPLEDLRRAITRAREAGFIVVATVERIMTEDL